MKKILSLLLCVCMVFALCACEQLDTIRNTELPPLPTPEAAPAAEKPAEDDAPAPEESEKPAEVSEAVEPYGAELGRPVIIRMKKTQEDFAAPQDGPTILKFSYVTPTVRIDGNQQAAEEINEQLRLLDEAYISGSGDAGGKNQLLESALDNYTYVHETGADLNTLFTSARTVKNTRADGSVISFRYWTSVYTGNANGSYAYSGFNFSTQTGEKLTLDALSSDPDALKETLVGNVIALAREDEELYAQISKNDIDADSALAAVVREGNWYFSNEGIVIYPSFGELRPDGESLPMFTVPYSALAGVMDEKYLPVRREGEASLEVVRLDEVEDGTVPSIDLLVVSDGEEIYLKVEGTAYDVTLSNFYYVDQGREDDERFFESDRLWYASYMTDCALQLRTVIPNGMPDLMISYTDADYVQHRLFLSENGADGGIALVDDTIQAVG
jgi:hypothetical protein